MAPESMLNLTALPFEVRFEERSEGVRAERRLPRGRPVLEAPLEAPEPSESKLFTVSSLLGRGAFRSFTGL